MRVTPPARGARPCSHDAYAACMTSTPDELDSDAHQFLHGVGERVRATRRACGMTQLRLAEVSGLGRQTILRLEQGKMNLSLLKLRTLAVALDTSVASLIPDDE